MLLSTAAIAESTESAPVPTELVYRPLVGHHSEETAFVVEDYPYGFTARTTIRYWLEEKPKFGARMCVQTVNPKKGTWNKPKKSGYDRLGGALYQDEQGHVHLAGFDEHKPEEAAWFLRTFPAAKTPDLKAWALAKIRYCKLIMNDNAHWYINDVQQPNTPAEVERCFYEMQGWQAVLDILASRV